MTKLIQKLFRCRLRKDRKGQDLVEYALMAGFIMTQIGIYMGTRYGRSPRPDEKLDAALKGLQNEFSMYHYTTPASHLLVGPSGVWLLFPYHQRGNVTVRKNRWQMSGGGFLQGYMRLFGQEGIGRPDLEAESEINALIKLFTKKLEGNEIPVVQAALVFMNDEAELQVEGAPLPALKLKQLKDFMRQKAKEKPLGQIILAAVKSALPE